MEMPSVTLANDSIGLGSMFNGMFGGLTSATKGTEQCGAKPTCISFGKNSQCAQKNKAYQDCLELTQNSQVRIAELSMQQQAKTPQSTSPGAGLWIGLAVIIIVLIIILKRK